MNKVIDGLKANMQAITDKESMNAEDLKFLEDCLYNKWYGVQVMASKVLAKHHTPEVTPLLKDWFLLHLGNLTMTSMAYRALLPCLQTTDIPWVLDLYFKYPTSEETLYLYRKDYFCYFLLMHALSHLVGKEADEAIEILIRACKTHDNKHHIRVLAHVPKSYRKRVLKALLENPKVHNKNDVKEWFRIASL
jgi:hypothetical protein